MKIFGQVIYSNSFNPWFNLALEDHLVDLVSQEAMEGRSRLILYLWQNDNTVVIGRNQNAWMECKTELLEEDGGRLARRSTGGGAVYHDLGNLNFSIITPKSMYETKRSLQIIVNAVNKAGIKAYASGRNDILAQEAKFSGNAFLVRKEAGLHHGTILVDSDYARIGKYLNVPAAKLEYKGIKSVKSRVINLAILNEGLTIEDMKRYVAEAFLEEYGPDIIESDYYYDEGDSDNFLDTHEKYASWDWRYGQTIKFTSVMEKYFSWGNIQLCFTVSRGKVDQAQIYTDALDSLFFAKLSKALEGERYELTDMIKTLEACEESPDILDFTGRSVKEDIKGLIEDHMYNRDVET